VDVGDTAGDRVLDRDHGEIGLAGLDGVEGVLEGRAGKRVEARVHVAAGRVGIRSRFALEGNLVGRHELGFSSKWMFGRNERGKRSGVPKSAAGHTAAEGAKRLQESVSGHPLRVAKSLTGQRPYMCCNGQAKDLVSARFRRPPGPDIDLRARRGATVEGYARVSQGALDNMDSFEINKLLGALLGTIFVIFSITLVSDALFAVHAPENPGYAIEATEEEGGEAA